MISSLAEFEEATVYERWVVSGIVPLPATRPHSGTKDPSANAVFVPVGVAGGVSFAGGITKITIDPRPLAFGAAWKILDLMIELGLSRAGITSAGGIKISAKVRQARLAFGDCPPLSSDTSLWRALTAVYAETKEIRHSLIHRLAEVDRTTGELTGRDSKGRPLPPITAEQQEAFCRAVQRAAEAAIALTISPRERADLAWNLDQLSKLHGQQHLGGKQIGPAALMLAPCQMTGTRLLINAPALLDDVKKNFPGRAAYDATVQLPDGRHVLVELEQAPILETAIDITALPSWAAFWKGPDLPSNPALAADGRPASSPNELLPAKLSGQSV